MSKSALILLSGGLDSAANLALAHERVGSELEQLYCIFFEYGQRAKRKEKIASQKLAQYYGAQFFSINLEWLGMLGGSALTDSSVELPEMQSKNLDNLSIITESAKAVWVPNRNGVFIQIAAAFAEAKKIQSVLVGFNREEAVTFPDNSANFLMAVNDGLLYSTQARVKAESLTVHLNKIEIVEKLNHLKKKFPFELVWSCYQDTGINSNGLENSICKECESCQRYLRATESMRVQK